MIALRYIIILIVLLSNVNSEDLFGDFLTELNDIATKTKQNIDYMPSTVSVLHANDLKELGANTVYDALSFIPGIETSMNQMGWKSIITRGLYNPDDIMFDKVKLFIDGSNMNGKLYGAIYYYMQFPLDLVERIEVLRGASSALYGEGAYNGAINIVTKLSDASEVNEAHLSYGSNDYRSITALSSFSIANFKGAIDVYGQKDNAHLGVSNDFIFDKTTFNRKSETNEALDNSGFGIKLSNDDFTIELRHNDYKTGNYFGLAEYLEPSSDGDFNQVQTTFAKLLFTKELSRDVTMSAKAEVQHNILKIAGTSLQMQPVDIGLTMDYEDLTIAYNAEFIVRNFSKHMILAGVEIDSTDVKRNSFSTNFDYINDENTEIGFLDSGNYVYFDNNGLIKDSADRNHFGVYLQDIYHATDKLTFSLNARYDNFKKFESDWNFRFGGVYDIYENVIIKAQYAESFRIASFLEAFQTQRFALRTGNDDLLNEEQQTYEFAVIVKPTMSEIIRANLYYSNIYNTIDILDTDINMPTYANRPKRVAKGFELEYKKEFENNSKFAFLYSYTTSTYTTPDLLAINMDTPSIANHLAKAYYSYSVNSKLRLGFITSYVGSRDPEQIDGIEADGIDSYIITNLSTSYDIDDSIKLQVSLNDIFNEQASFPSYRSQHQYLPREGRTFMTSLNFSF